MPISSGNPPRRPADTRLRDFVDTHAAAGDPLPLVHITRAYAFDTIVQGDQIDPSFCPIFHENLIYLFYGRPAYRAKDGTNARLEFEWPIVFVFDSNKVTDIRRVFPFDTGAFHMGLYDEFFDKKSALKDFALSPHVDSAKKLVGAFYTNNKEYYTGYSRKNVDIPLRQFEAQGIHELSRLPGVQGENSGRRRDDRSSAIEFQVGASISFKTALLGLLLPEPYLDDAEIKRSLVRWGVQEIMTYSTLHNHGSEAWVGQIYSLVKTLYEKLGIL